MFQNSNSIRQSYKKLQKSYTPGFNSSVYMTINKWFPTAELCIFKCSSAACSLFLRGFRKLMIKVVYQGTLVFSWQLLMKHIMKNLKHTEKYLFIFQSFSNNYSLFPVMVTLFQRPVCLHIMDRVDLQGLPVQQWAKVVGAKIMEFNQRYSTGQPLPGLQTAFRFISVTVN